MELFWILLVCIAGLIAIVLLIALGCFLMAFYTRSRKPLPEDVIEIPNGRIYEAFREPMTQWTKEVRQMPREEMSITSFDGLTLRGRFYELAPGAPIELMFHGYRGNSERDLAGGVQRCFRLGRSVLLVDQRGCGRSDGHVISFGVKEHKDCLVWVDFMVRHFGPNVRIILTGVSMGAATVMMAAGKPLPPNVKGVLADCGYSTTRDIIYKVIKQMKLPPKLVYPFLKLGARLYGRFDLDETSPVEAMGRCTVPVIFFHGEKDDFVPCSMSRVNFEACTARKKLVTIPGAGHGLCYPVAPEIYLKALQEFFPPEIFLTAGQD